MCVITELTINCWVHRLLVWICSNNRAYQACDVIVLHIKTKKNSYFTGTKKEKENNSEKCGENVQSMMRVSENVEMWMEDIHSIKSVMFCKLNLFSEGPSVCLSCTFGQTAVVPVVEGSHSGINVKGTTQQMAKRCLEWKSPKDIC